MAIHLRISQFLVKDYIYNYEIVVGIADWMCHMLEGQ